MLVFLLTIKVKSFFQFVKCCPLAQKNSSFHQFSINLTYLVCCFNQISLRNSSGLTVPQLYSPELFLIEEISTLIFRKALIIRS
jgi:hypothetical protein